MNLNSPDLPKVFLPPVNRSMQTLDKSFFRKVVPLAAASVSDVRQITHVRKELDRSGDVLKISPLKHLREDDSAPGAKCILLRHRINPKGASIFRLDIPRIGANKCAEVVTWSPAITKLVEDSLAKIRPYDLTLTYDDWTMRT